MNALSVALDNRWVLAALAGLAAFGLVGAGILLGRLRAIRGQVARVKDDVHGAVADAGTDGRIEVNGREGNAGNHARS